MSKFLFSSGGGGASQAAAGDGGLGSGRRSQGAAVRLAAAGGSTRRARPGEGADGTSRVALCVPVCKNSPRRGKAEPRALQQGRFPSPRFRLLSTERRSEWKPSPNMTSKLLLTMS